MDYLNLVCLDTFIGTRGNAVESLDAGSIVKGAIGIVH